MAKIIASEGADWVIARIPNKYFPQFQKDLEQAVLNIMGAYGYDEEIRAAFKETSPVVVKR